ncbi:MAG: hypothetical protein ACREDT_03385 [Methylocella sp.]
MARSMEQKHRLLGADELTLVEKNPSSGIGAFAGSGFGGAAQACAGTAGSRRQAKAARQGLMESAKRALELR